MIESNLDNTATFETPQRTTTAKAPPILMLALCGTVAVLAGAGTAVALRSPKPTTTGFVGENDRLHGARHDSNSPGAGAEVASASPRLQQRVEDVEASLMPDFPVNERAISVGKPNRGWLIDGVQLPASPAYIRRTPRTTWGSGQTIASLQRAISSFRREVDYEGELILGDISARSGGPLHPHMSHQAGRDVDLWLPTLEGVFKREHLGHHGEKPRPPMFGEVDWHATWGLLHALLETGAVERVFLERRYQELVVQAALEAGSAPEALETWFQWPRLRPRSTGSFGTPRATGASFMSASSARTGSLIAARR